MITQEQIKATIERAEKQIEEMKQLLNTVDAEQEGRKEGQKYWYATSCGDVRMTNNSEFQSDDEMYECGNYYLTSEDANRAEKQIRLFRLLDRFSRQNGWTDEIWQDDEKRKYYIYFDHIYNQIRIGDRYCTVNAPGVYFVSDTVALQAMQKYHDLIMEVMAI